MKPVYILTGFLGSGKTTLLNRWLSEPALHGTAVIVNEFGDIPIDHHLIASPDPQMVVLSNGCICCTLREDLAATLSNLEDQFDQRSIPAFDRVVIETTGLADPYPIIHTLLRRTNISNRFFLAKTIVTIDMHNALRTQADHTQWRMQVASADILVRTKTDLAAPDAGLDALLYQINPTAKVIDATEASAIELSSFLNPASARYPDKSANPVSSMRDSMFHCDDATITSFSMTIVDPVPWAKIALWLDGLAFFRGADLLRLKGIVNVLEKEGPIVIQGVQQMFYPAMELDRWPDENRHTRIVFITRGISRDAIEATWRAVASLAV